jgi:hypothetical protein
MNESSYVVEWYDSQQRLHTTELDHVTDERLIPFQLHKLFRRRFGKVKKITLKLPKPDGLGQMIPNPEPPKKARHGRRKWCVRCGQRLQVMKPGDKCKMCGWVWEKKIPIMKKAGE